MRAMLEHSQKTYGPLPSELRALRRRSRTLSRPSPYPRTRKVSQSSNESHTELPSICMAIYGNASQPTLPLQEVSVNANIQVTVNAKAQSPVPALPLKPFTPFHVEFKEKVQPALPKESTNLGLPVPRPRVPSNARRNALGWTKRSTGKSSNDNKENVAYGTLMRYECLDHYERFVANVRLAPMNLLGSSAPAPVAAKLQPRALSACDSTSSSYNYAHHLRSSKVSHVAPVPGG